jgi:hypothetical protein
VRTPTPPSRKREAVLRVSAAAMAALVFAFWPNPTALVMLMIVIVLVLALGLWSCSTGQERRPRQARAPHRRTSLGWPASGPGRIAQRSAYTCWLPRSCRQVGFVLVLGFDCCPWPGWLPPAADRTPPQSGEAA